MFGKKNDRKGMKKVGKIANSILNLLKIYKTAKKRLTNLHWGQKYGSNRGGKHEFKIQYTPLFIIQLTKSQQSMKHSIFNSNQCQC